MTLSAGPVAEDEEIKKLKEKHIDIIRRELGTTGTVQDPKIKYERDLAILRYEFGKRGMILEEKEAIKIWNSWYLK